MFRVLIVDDKQKVLDAAKDWIENRMKLGSQEYHITLFMLHVEVLETESGYKISDRTLQELNEYCKSPFDLILLDFGYIKKGLDVNEQVENLKKDNPDKTDRELIDEIILNPTDIVNEASKSNRFINIKRNFTNYKGKIYVYTYIPNKLENKYTCIDVRKNVTNKCFKTKNIEIIDARNELFNNSMFDGINSKYSLEYYSFLISKLLSKIIKIEIAENILQNNLMLKDKFEKIKKSNRILSISIILPSIIAGIFIPSLLSYFEQNNYIIAIALIVTLSIIIFISIIGPRYLEKQQEKWLK